MELEGVGDTVDVSLQQVVAPTNKERNSFLLEEFLNLGTSCL